MCANGSKWELKRLNNVWWLVAGDTAIPWTRQHIYEGGHRLTKKEIVVRLRTEAEERYKA